MSEGRSTDSLDVSRARGRDRWGAIQIGRSGGFSLAVRPEIGSKIVSMSHAGGQEWLAPPVRPLQPILGYPGSWGDHDCSGWDECFPNIAADAMVGLADHGDVWFREWTTSKVGTTGDISSYPRSITTSITMPERYRLERCLGVDNRYVTADYRVDALGEKPMHWAWAQHPMLAADEHTRIVLPTPARVRLEVAFVEGRPSHDVDWLCPGGILPRVASLTQAQGRAAKLWFEPPLPRYVAIVRAHDWIAWRLDRSSVPHAGLWINLGGWDGSGGDSPLAHVGVEPAFGAHDTLVDAVRTGTLPVLGTGEHHRWRVVLESGVRNQPARG